MKTLAHALWYFFDEAAHHLMANRVMTGLAVATTAVAFFIMGLLLLFNQTDEYVFVWGSEFSQDGRIACFAPRTRAWGDGWVHDADTGVTAKVTRLMNVHTAALSPNGQRAAFIGSPLRVWSRPRGWGDCRCEAVRRRLRASREARPTRAPPRGHVAWRLLGRPKRGIITPGRR